MVQQIRHERCGKGCCSDYRTAHTQLLAGGDGSEIPATHLGIELEHLRSDAIADLVELACGDRVFSRKEEQIEKALGDAADERSRLHPKPLTPEQILKRRHASGEIDQSTYERMLRSLREGPGLRGGENERGAES